MKVKDLKRILEHHGSHIDEREVLIRLTLPSMGPVASETVESAHVGFDWDRDLILEPSRPLVPKEEKQSIFESGYDLLMWLATKPMARESYEVRTAKGILKRHGKTEEDFKKFRHLFHKDEA